MPERAASAGSESPPHRHDLPAADGDGPGLPGFPDLSGLPVTGFTRRRMGFLGAGVLASWVVISFARQVGDASAATSRLEGSWPNRSPASSANTS